MHLLTCPGVSIGLFLSEMFELNPWFEPSCSSLEYDQNPPYTAHMLGRECQEAVLPDRALSQLSPTFTFSLSIYLSLSFHCHLTEAEEERKLSLHALVTVACPEPEQYEREGDRMAGGEERKRGGKEERDAVGYCCLATGRAT